MFDHVNIHLDHGHGFHSYRRGFPLVIVISWQLRQQGRYSHYVRKKKTWNLPLFAWKHTKSSSSTRAFIYIELTLVSMQLLAPQIQKGKNGAWNYILKKKKVTVFKSCVCVHQQQRQRNQIYWCLIVLVVAVAEWRLSYLILIASQNAGIATSSATSLNDGK